MLSVRGKKIIQSIGENNAHLKLYHWFDEIALKNLQSNSPVHLKLFSILTLNLTK
jgi:hypothetical protein